MVGPAAVRSLQVADPSDHRPGLGVLVLVAFHDRIRARIPVREHRILTDQDCGSRAQYLRGAPVVLSQSDDRRTRKVGGEAVQVVGIGTVPGVDGLVRIAHHAEIGSTVQP